MEILNIFILVVAVGAALIALLTAVSLLFPGPVGRARQVLENNLWKSFLVGLVNFLFLAVIAVLLARLAEGLGGVGGAIFMALILIIGLMLAVLNLQGASGMAGFLGERLGGRPPIGATLKGGVLILLACLTPFIGWYVFAPFILLCGLGASIFSLFQRNRKTTAETRG